MSLSPARAATSPSGLPFYYPKPETRNPIPSLFGAPFFSRQRGNEVQVEKDEALALASESVVEVDRYRTRLVESQVPLMCVLVCVCVRARACVGARARVCWI